MRKERTKGRKGRRKEESKGGRERKKKKFDQRY